MIVINRSVGTLLQTVSCKDRIKASFGMELRELSCSVALRRERYFLTVTGTRRPEYSQPGTAFAAKVDSALYTIQLASVCRVCLNR